MSTAPKSKKRRSGEDGEGSKKRRKRAVQEDDPDLDVEAGLNRAFERMDGQLLADHLAQKTRRFGTDLSTIELSDLDISGKKGERDTTANRRSLRERALH